VVFRIGPENHRSRRAIEKIGALFVGVEPERQGIERVVYAITRNGWTMGV
jgi:RimJ/RimL family protein N-acetyltransferase